MTGRAGTRQDAPVPAAAFPRLDEVLRLAPAGEDVFVSRARDVRGRTFGGETAAQALVAAAATVAEDRRAHSLHAQYLSPGDAGRSSEYRVARSRDGGAFSSRSVDVWQGDVLLMRLLASFAVGQRGLWHDSGAPGPSLDESIPFDGVFATDPELSAWAHGVLRNLGADARRPAIPPEQPGPLDVLWLRAHHPVGSGSVVQAAALTYLSDLFMIPPAMAHHGLVRPGPDRHGATINHSVWFHAPVDVDDWFLTSRSSDWAGDGRAITRSLVTDQRGRLCASVVQESLIRDGRPRASAMPAHGRRALRNL